MDLETEFEEKERAQLKPNYLYKEPTREAQHTHCLQKIFTQYYQQDSYIFDICLTEIIASGCGTYGCFLELVMRIQTFP